MSDADMLLAAIAALWLAATACLAAARLLGGARDSILVLILIHFMLCGLPLWLDVLVGQPEYASLPGFLLASQDSLTNAIYCLYVSAVPVLWWRVGQARGGPGPDEGTPELGPASWETRRVRRFAVAGMFAPVAAVLASPDPWVYATYGVALGTDEVALSMEAQEHHVWVSLASQVGMVSAAVLLASWRPLSLLHLVPVAPFLGLAMWVNGKRSLVACSLLLLGYVLWRRRVLRGISLAAGAVVAYLAFMGFSTVYQSQLRSGSSAASVGPLESMRIDFGRDHVIKLAIFAELEPDTVQILEHRGQSLHFYATMYVPRDWYPDKPYPYAQYVTSAMLLTPPRLRGWGMTTCVLDEAIANFGWLGMLAGPLLVALVCRAGDATRSTTLAAIAVLVSTLLMTVHAVAFAPIAGSWALATAWTLATRAPTPAPTAACTRQPRATNSRVRDGPHPAPPL